MKKLTSILFISAGISTLQGYPYQFRRLIQHENGKITKVVDLISDDHVLTTHPVPDVEQLDPFLQEHLLADEKDKLDTASRRLVAILRFFAKNSIEKIDLLLESKKDTAEDPFDPDFVKEYLKIQSTQNVENDTLRFLARRFLAEFSPDKKQNIIAKPTDTIRNNLKIGPFIGCFFWSNEPTIFNLCSRVTIDELAIPFFSVLLFFEHSVNKLCSKKTTFCPRIFLKLKQIWEKNKKQIEAFHDKHFKETLSQTHRTPFSEFLLKLTKKFYATFNQIIVNNLMDFESLVSILSSERKHIILYAGGAHCEGISHQLVEHFDFEEVTNVGIRTISKFISPLSEKAWNFLVEIPENSIQREKVINVVDNQLLIELFTQLRNPQRAGSETEILELLTEGATAYVDIANVQERTTGNTPYHYAIQNGLTKTVWKLDELNANKYIKNNEGKTPLDYLRTPPESIENRPN